MTKLSKLEEEIERVAGYLSEADIKAIAQVALQWIETIAFKVMKEDHAMGGETVNEQNAREFIRFIIAEELMFKEAKCESEKAKTAPMQKA